MILVYIHGNAATSDSFNFIRAQILGYPEIMLDYDSKAGFDSNYHAMLERLHDQDGLFFIAHSLGGIYALHLANDLPGQVLGGVTISTPYGGSRAAQLVQMMLPFHQVLHDIHPHSAPITRGRDLPLPTPWINIVSTGGSSPLMALPNDGVVTQRSMRFRTDMELMDVPSNHYEILLSNATVEIVRKAVERAARKEARRAARNEARRLARSEGASAEGASQPS